MRANRIKTVLLLFLFWSVAMLFVACNVQIKYKINFYVDGAVYDTINSDGQDISMPNDPIKPGYTFDGWFYDEDTWEEPFTLQSLLNQSLREDNQVDLYAKFTEKSYDYQVTFKGFEKIGDEYVTKISASVTKFSLADKIILGDNLTCILSKDENFSEVLSPDAILLDERQNIVYVKVINTYGQNKIYTLRIEKTDAVTVTFDTEGGSYIPDQLVEYGMYAVRPAETPERYGYIFLNWDFDFSTPITQDTEIRAIWKENHYTIQYRPNGGSGTMQESIVEPGSPFALSRNDYEKSGYTFIGWRLGEEIFRAGQEIIDLANVGDTVSLSAEWRANQYIVNYDKGDEFAGDSMPLPTFTYDTAQNLSRNTFYKSGYSFDGWVYNGKKYTDGESVKNLAQSGAVMLTATWKPYTFTLKYESGEDTDEFLTQKLTYDTDFRVEYPTFGKTGYTFVKWKTADGLEIEPGYTLSANIFLSDDVSLKDGDEIVLNAVWRANNYTVDYRMPNYGFFYRQEVSYDEEFALAECPSFFEKTGYAFDGWSVPDKGICHPGDLMKNLTDKDGDSVVVYVRWRAISYTLVFDVLDGECEPLQPVQVAYDDTIYFTRTEPFKEGYTFVGYHYQNKYLGKTGMSVKNLTSTDGAILTLRAIYRYNYMGQGTADNPYLLDSAESVLALSDFMLADYFSDDSRNHSAWFRLTKDIDMQGASLSPFCNFEGFNGVFDGNLFTISNFELKAGLKGYREENLGFIAKNNGTIRNLFLKDLKVSADASVPYVGCMAGYNSGVIEYCEVSGAEIVVSAQGETEKLSVGGFVGRASTSATNDSGITGCKFNGNFSIDGTNILSVSFGGMIGIGTDLLHYCFVDYSANICNAEYVTANTIAECYEYDTTDIISTLATVNLTIDCLHLTLNVQADALSDIYYSSDSAIVLTGDGAGSLPLQDITLIDKNNYRDFSWVCENVHGFQLASWEFDGVNDPFISRNPTKPTPRAISSAQDLSALSGKQVSGSYYLTCDIDLGGAEWTPFDLYGIFDGKGHKIHNFVITRPTDDKTASFIEENHGEILSLYISDYSITITPDKIIGNPYTLYVGGLVAYNFGTIRFVKADGYINAEMPTSWPDSKYAVAGGLVAVNHGDIYSSYVVADITVYANLSLTVGGLVGNGENGQIVNCYTTGSIAGQSYEKSGASGGGIVGQSGYYQYTVVKNSFTDCDMRLIGNKNTAQVYPVAKYTENCYSSLGQKIFYNGEELIFESLDIIDESNFKSPTYLKNRLKFGTYSDEETLAADYTKAWLLQNDAFPKLYFESD